jgi:hypothetical protein
MTSTVKVNNVQASDGGNIINQCGTNITIGASGDTIALASGASQTGFGRTGTVDWDTTPKTATFTAVSGDGFFCNTESGGFTVNLPAGVAGAIVSLADYAGTWQTGNLVVSPNGTDKIGGSNASVTLNTEGQSVTFVFVDSTQGWVNVQDSTSNERGNPFIEATGGTITTSGNDKIHTFTGPGTFTVCQAAACAANNVVSYMVIAGGSGGGSYGAGGGGAGGYREVKSPVTPYTASPLDGYPSAPNRITVSATNFPITVGAGSSGAGPGRANASNGSPSIFSTITSAGGGGGVGNITAGLAGGSGGGGSGGAGPSTSNPHPGGAGNTPPVSPAQGNNGGNGWDAQSVNTNGGGGGGAGAVGSNAASATGGNGGAGTASSINTTPTTRAGGGGGGTDNGGSGGGTAGTGGPGGGGNGANNPGNGSAGTVNTGSGGGGGGYSGPGTSIGGNGGSGLVIIRYKFQ